MPAALALVLALAAAEPAPAPAQEFHFAGIPALAYGSDVGLTLGAATFMYRPSAVAGRFERLSLGASIATRGPRSLDVQWEAPRAAAGFGALLDLRLADDDREPYWGAGGALGGLAVPPGAGSAPLPYRFHDRRLFAAATVRPATAASPAPWARARLLAVDVRDPGPLLGAERPLGSGGGSALLWEAGVLVDRRDRDVGTRRGVYGSASLFAAPAVGPLGPGTFAGGDVTASAFWPAAERVTVAAHLLVDAKLGAVPFYEESQYEGIAYGGGLGGAGTVRGLARLRMPGDTKALATVELRSSLYGARPLAERKLDLGLAAGCDAGWARERGHAPLAALGGFAGVRALWDDAVVLRVEVGYAGQGSTALYVVTGEQF